MHWNGRSLVATVTIVAFMILWSVGPALAHGGHTHNEGGFDTSVVLQVGGAAAVLTTAYILAGRVYRYRDALRDDAGAEESGATDR